MAWLPCLEVRLDGHGHVVGVEPVRHWPLVERRVIRLQVGRVELDRHRITARYLSGVWR